MFVEQSADYLEFLTPIAISHEHLWSYSTWTANDDAIHRTPDAEE
jgi:hypothetical protein